MADPRFAPPSECALDLLRLLAEECAWQVANGRPPARPSRRPDAIPRLVKIALNADKGGEKARKKTEEMMPHRESRWAPAERAVNVVIALACHALGCAFFLICIWALEALMQRLWAETQPMLFGYIPLKYVFHAMDLGTLGVFGVRGLIEANDKLKGT